MHTVTKISVTGSPPTPSSYVKCGLKVKAISPFQLTYSLESTFCVKPQSKTQTVALTPIPLPGLRMAYMFLYMNYIAYCQK